MIKLIENFKNGWKIKKCDETKISSANGGLWSEYIETDDFVKPFFDIDLKVNVPDGNDKDKYFEDISEEIINNFTFQIECVYENNDMEMPETPLLLTKAHGYNKEKESDFVSLHLVMPDFKILYQNMEQLISDFNLEKNEIELMGEKIEYNLDMNIYGRSKLVFRLINNDKPLNKFGARAGRIKMRYKNYEGFEDQDFCVSNPKSDNKELKYEFMDNKKYKKNSKKTSKELNKQSSDNGEIKYGKHFIEQYVKKKYGKEIKYRREYEDVVYFDLDASNPENRKCQFKDRDPHRNHGDPKAHAVFANYFMFNKNTGQLFKRCRCKDGEKEYSCAEASLEITLWKSKGAWEKAFKEQGEDAMVELINKSICHIRYEGSKQVYVDRYNSNKLIDFLSINELKECYLDEGWQGKGDKWIHPIEIWRRNRNHLKLDKRVFDPSRDLISDGLLNLWRGYNINLMNAKDWIENSYDWDKAKDDWLYYKNHLEEILCDGDLEVANFVLNWMSFVLQKPHLKSEVMLIIGGPEGSGKSSVFGADSCWQRIISKDLNGLYYSTSETNRIFGRFNDRLADVKFMMLNEALFSGDKKHQGQLKELITDPIITTEKKFAQTLSFKQYYEIVALSNNEKNNPLGNSRRPCPIKTSSKFSPMGKTKEQKKEIKKYFDKLFKVPPEVVAYYLYVRDISKFVPSKEIPKTEYAIKQNEYHRTPVQRFIIDMAHHGYKRYRGGCLIENKQIEFIPNFLFLKLTKVNLFECFKSYMKMNDIKDRYDEINADTLLSQIESNLGKELFKRKSIGVKGEKGYKGEVGFCGIGVVKTREFLEQEHGIKDWDNDLSWCSGCYRKTLYGVLIDVEDDIGGLQKDKNFKGGLKLENIRIEYSTFKRKPNGEYIDDERIRLELIKKEWFNVKDGVGKLKSDIVLPPEANYDSDKEFDGNDTDDDVIHPLNNELNVQVEDVGLIKDQAIGGFLVESDDD
jgi:hypothetical protein